MHMFFLMDKLFANPLRRCKGDVRDEKLEKPRFTFRH